MLEGELAVADRCGLHALPPLGEPRGVVEDLPDLLRGRFAADAVFELEHLLLRFGPGDIALIDPVMTAGLWVTR